MSPERSQKHGGRLRTGTVAPHPGSINWFLKMLLQFFFFFFPSSNSVPREKMEAREVGKLLERWQFDVSENDQPPSDFSINFAIAS